jgi:hypothetical protein
VEIYLVYDDSCPTWSAVRGAFEEKTVALQHAKYCAGSDYKFIEDEERWEGPDRRSVWVDKISVTERTASCRGCGEPIRRRFPRQCIQCAQ